MGQPQVVSPTRTGRAAALTEQDPGHLLVLRELEGETLVGKRIPRGALDEHLQDGWVLEGEPLPAAAAGQSEAGGGGGG